MGVYERWVLFPSSCPYRFLPTVNHDNWTAIETFGAVMMMKGETEE